MNGKVFMVGSDGEWVPLNGITAIGFDMAPDPIMDAPWKPLQKTGLYHGRSRPQRPGVRSASGTP
jgi:hypothetical protein